MRGEFDKTTRLLRVQFLSHREWLYLLTIDIQIIQFSKLNKCVVQRRLCDLLEDMFNVAKSRLLLLYYYIINNSKEQPYLSEEESSQFLSVAALGCRCSWREE